jgi:DNA-binding GntR family transcriptional regulator
MSALFGEQDRHANGNNRMSFLKSKNLAYEIADVLSDRIIHMEYKPGDRIIESKIAKELNVSQSSIREALRILEQSGLVEINQRRGTYVTELSISNVTILYDLISGMYALLIRKAMEKKSDFNAQKVIEVYMKMQKSAEENDVDNYYKSIFDLALVALEVTESFLLKKAITDLWPNKRRIEYMTLSWRKNDLKENLKYFESLVNSFNDSDVERMVEVIKEYAQNEKVFAISILKKNKLM